MEAYITPAASPQPPESHQLSHNNDEVDGGGSDSANGTVTTGTAVAVEPLILSALDEETKSELFADFPENPDDLDEALALEEKKLVVDDATEIPHPVTFSLVEEVQHPDPAMIDAIRAIIDHHIQARATIPSSVDLPTREEYMLVLACLACIPTMKIIEDYVQEANQKHEIMDQQTSSNTPRIPKLLRSRSEPDAEAALSMISLSGGGNARYDTPKCHPHLYVQLPHYYQQHHPYPHQLPQFAGSGRDSLAITPQVQQQAQQYLMLPRPVLNSTGTAEGLYYPQQAQYLPQVHGYSASSSVAGIPVARSIPSSGPSFSTPQQSRKSRIGTSREDTKYDSLTDYAPPLSTLKEKGVKEFEMDWKGQVLDLSNDPDKSMLDPLEVKLAATLRLSCATYLCSKRRIFEARVNALKIGKEFRKTDAQQACKIDVNKASKLWIAFDRVGWFDPVYFRKYLD